ncbi:MAG TPA: zinc ribbon domain-containing protein [Gemmatimonadales bacterium]|nr:zinc ribbon domain-containing protein [Gemmatimonadales bacterium]
MTDLERLFSLIVTNLAATDPARLGRPIPLAELTGQIIPYRSSRRQLDVVTTEEYETLVLRLAAGEAGLAETRPSETQARFRRELDALQPDLHVLGIDEGASLLLSRDAVARVLGGASFAPPEAPEPAAVRASGSTPAPPPVHDVEIIEWETGHEIGREQCSFCGGALPHGRVVNFCPHCGESLRALHCPACHEEVELGWRHCVSCGSALGEQ